MIDTTMAFWGLSCCVGGIIMFLVFWYYLNH